MGDINDISNKIGYLQNKIQNRKYNGEALLITSFSPSMYQSHVARAEYIFHSFNHYKCYGMWIFDFHTGKTKWSNGLFQILEQPVSTSEVTVEDLFQYVVPDQQANVADALSDMLLSRGMFRYETQIVTNNGKKLPVTFFAELICNKQGKAKQIFGSVVPSNRDHFRDNSQSEGTCRIRCSLPVGLAEINENGKIAYLNCAMASSFGSEKEKMLASPVYKNIPKRTLINPYRMAIQAFKTMHPIVYEEQRNGRFFLNLIIPFLRNGERSIQIASLDKTAEHIQTESIKNSEEKYRSLVEESNDIIYSHDANGILTFLTTNVFEKLGYRKDELLGKPIDTIIHKDDFPHIFKRIGMLATKSQIKMSDIQFRVKHKEGHYLWHTSNVTSIYRDEINSYRIEGIARNIHQQKLKEEQLEKEKSKLSTYFENAPYGIFITDAKGYCNAVNIEACNLTEKREEELEGKLLSQLIFKNDVEIVKSGFTQIHESGKTNFTVRFDVKGKRIKYVAVKAVKLEDNQLLIFANDITREIEDKREIEHKNDELKELNGMKDKFFSIIAHDLKNPFTNLLGFIQLLAQTHTTIDDKKRARYISLVSDSGWQIFKLLENLLTWSRINRNQMHKNIIEAPIYPLIKDTVQLLSQNAEKKSIALKVKNDESITIKADVQILQTVLRNLISNAIKFTPGNGEVNVSYTIKNTRYLQIAVQDNGIGIPEEHHNKIFHIDENFSRQGTNDEEGTGLGLILCKEFVQKNNGKIWFESKPNQGSMFYFTVPLS